MHSSWETAFLSRCVSEGYPVTKVHSLQIPYIAHDGTEHTYIPDFKLSNGIYVEAKGVFNAIQRKKLINILDSNPDKDIRILLMRDNYINRGSKTKYSDWCVKRGIKYHVSSSGHVPEEWYSE